MRILFIDIGPKRNFEPTQSYGTAVLVATLKRAYPTWECELIHYEQAPHTQEWSSNEISKVEWRKYSAICMSVNLWNQTLVCSLGRMIDKSYSIPVFLGGPMIAGCNHDLARDYPFAHCLVKGYGEVAMIQFEQLMHGPRGVVFSNQCITNSISPYLSEVFDLNTPSLKVRMETRRGCPFRCSFCTHRNPETAKTEAIGSKTRWQQEFELFQSKMVSKVNMVNPFFNEGSYGEAVLEEAVNAGLNAELALQIRPDPLVRQARLLELAQALNTTLEVGVQSLDEDVLKIIRRGGMKRATLEGLKLAISKKLRLEVTLIYGLPRQTLSSFQSTIHQLQDIGIENIVAFPLQILPFTPMFQNAHSLELRTRLDPWGIPVVVESPWFKENEHNQMRALADELKVSGSSTYLEKRL